ncbi:tryptophan 7-halogenase [Sphingomonas sp. S2-65]|uniref:tryptophan 7-halogenase n=1 Tax=Sphingomonas sp. S2-65 TaxID=2903960 RepID=UPI001F185FC1|nr:tryptophan 7-halogenase [Sphingomonas sp. S2-65]UYY59316.1 tryptophan 7-halogenase [Sphingomonas sp. S2-65]
MTSAPIRSVAVVGRDAAAWILALGLHRALRRIGVSVRVVELPSMLQPMDVHSALPSLASLHALLGLDEAALFTHCQATPVMGQQFMGWDAPGGAFIHGYDLSRPAINNVDFVQFWAFARRRGMRVPLEEFSLAAVSAKQGRIASGAVGDSVAAAPGYHIEARAYAALLRQGCVAAGIELLPSGSIRVEGRPERLKAVVLEDGMRIEADLFIDASGAERALIGGMAGAAFDDWRHWFPADRIVTGALPPLDPPPAHARILAGTAGWIGLFPVQGFTALVGHFAIEGRSDEDAARRLLADAGVDAGGLRAIRPRAAGALRQSWIGNCIAVGEGAVTLERLDGVELHLLQLAVSNLVASWPVDRNAMPEAREYDRAMASHISNIRDFQLAHYRLSRRTEPFWTGARAGDLPPRLAARLALFGARGLLSHYDDETFLAQSWAAMLIGHGLVPADSDPAVERTPPGEQMGKLQELLHVIAEQVRTMPGIADYIAARKRSR